MTPKKRAFAKAKRVITWYSRALVALLLGIASFALLPAAMASAASSSIGVFVDQPTTTLPPATTTPPAATTPPPATTTPPTTTAPATTVPSTVPVTVPTQDTLPDVPAQTNPVVQEDTGVIATVKKAASGTKKIVSDVVSGKPVADAIQAVLPSGAADVVVPAVRTASTFVFPIGLAGAVIAFLGLQQRIDAGDPKLTAAPLAHDDDEVTFT